MPSTSSRRRDSSTSTLVALAYYTPSTFTPVGPWVATLLMLIMFGMGVHLNVDDFKRVLSRP
ncbi:hypothetical protein MJI47_27305, partial [Salmonella enterica subsp. enterica serovar Kentucky]|nr:hypothetical protein [Salmonella enterica subsp. enterica serovar Kentucky]